MFWRGRNNNKYGAKPVVDHGLRFDSTGEFKRWCDLVMLQKAGNITDLKRQVSFDLAVNGVEICRYIADFVYSEHLPLHGISQRVVEDFKSKATMTPIFSIKRKLMKACHGIEVRLTGKGVK